MLKKVKNKKTTTCDCLKTILSSIWFFTRQEISLWPKRLKSGPKRIKNPIKTHIEVLNIQKFSRGGPQTPLTRGGIIPFSCSPPLVPSALDGFLRRTTFQYAATALYQDDNLHSYNLRYLADKTGMTFCIRDEQTDAHMDGPQAIEIMLQL